MHDTEFQEIINRLVTNKTSRLNLSGINITNKRAQSLSNAIATNTSLVELFLYDCQISSKGAQKIANALKINTSLAALFMGNNQIGDAGAKAISEALKKSSSLIKLDLSMNEISDVGADKLIEGLINNTSLKKLTISSNLISTEVAQNISNQIHINKKIDILLLNDKEFSPVFVRNAILEYLREKNSADNHTIAPPSLIHIASGEMRYQIAMKNASSSNQVPVLPAELRDAVNLKPKLRLFHVSYPMQHDEDDTLVKWRCEY